MDKRVNPISPAAQLDLGLGATPEQLQRKRPADPGYREIHEKYNPPEKDPKGKAAENKEFEDKRQQRSKLIQQTEMDKIKEIFERSKGGGGGGGMPKLNRDLTKNYKAGGKVKSASARADGCCVKGKTKGRMV
jgi:hypothetical protein